MNRAAQGRTRARMHTHTTFKKQQARSSHTLIDHWEITQMAAIKPGENAEGNQGKTLELKLTLKKREWA